MNAFTFTNTKAGEILAQELSQANDGGRAQRFISHVLGKYFKGLKNIKEIQDKQVRETLLTIWQQHHAEKVAACKALPEVCKNLALNVLKTKIRILKTKF